MSTEQYNQIIEAILAGRYSWACVLILRFTGCNPLQYMPYRTYNRLLKENYEEIKESGHRTKSINTDNKPLETNTNSSCAGYLKRISDLECFDM